MKEKIGILLFGMSIHPGNTAYLFCIFVIPLGGLLNKNYSEENSFIFAGIIFIVMLVIFVPLYIYTSYRVGKINIDLKPED